MKTNPRRHTWRRILPALAAVLLMVGCEIDQKDFKQEENFIKIYNHPDDELAYHPEGLAELPGGGFLILSGIKDDSAAVEFPYANLIRTSATGEVEWSEDYPYLAPAPSIFQLGGSTGFLAMDNQLKAYAVVVDPATGAISSTHDLDVTMPLHCMVDRQNNLLVLGYDFVSRSSWVALFDATFGLQRSLKLNVNTDLENKVQKHLNKSGTQYPFFMGEWDNGSNAGYFVNCFYNYSLRTVFLEGTGLELRGNIYSFQTEAAVSSVIHRSGDTYALTRFYGGNNYLLGEVDVDIDASQNFNNLTGEILQELTLDAHVIARPVSIGPSDYILFTSQTNSNSLVSYQHAAGSDSLIRTHYFPFNERVGIADLVQTADEGVGILGQIYVLGKYRRPVLIRVPAGTFD